MSGVDFEFGFFVSRATAGGPVQGSFAKNARGTGLGLVSTSVTRFQLSGNLIIIEGTCVKLTGERCTFLAFVQDNGAGGSNDVFQVRTDDGSIQGGTIKSGDIRLVLP